MSDLVVWLPLVLLLVAFGLFLRRSTRTYYEHVNQVNAVNQAIVDTNNEMIAELREIKDILRDRN